MDKQEIIQSSPEFSFVLLCACLNPSPEQEQKIKNSAQMDLDWPLVFKIAQTQRVLPLLYQNMAAIVPDIDPYIAEKFKSVFIKNMARNIRILYFLNDIITLFKKNNIDVIPFKGPVSAQDIYGDISLRAFSDIDLLIKTKSAEKAWQLLIENGFKPELNLTKGQIKKYIAVEDNITFLCPKNPFPVELHWEMSGIYLSGPLLFDHVENRVKPLKIENYVFQSLSLEDCLIYLCVHGTKHGWDHLEQVCLISELIRQKKDLDWNLIDKLAGEWKCINMMLLGFNLARSILDAPLPLFILSKIKKNSLVLKTSKKIIQDMYSKQDTLQVSDQSERFSFFHIYMKDTLYDKTLYLLRLVFRPTKKEWLHFPVPAWLSFLHYFLRPYRLITEGIRKQHA